MDPKILDFLNKELIAAFSIALPDGTPHTAAIHYSFVEQPLRLYIHTSNKSLKAKALLNGDMQPASVAIGFRADRLIALQMHGKAKLVNDLRQIELIAGSHFYRHPTNDATRIPNSVFIEFTPTWMRYSDFTQKPPVIIEETKM